MRIASLLPFALIAGFVVGSGPQIGPDLLVLISSITIIYLVIALGELHDSLSHKRH
jgi:hypothetical protein